MMALGGGQGSASGVELGQVRAYRMQDRVNRQQNAFNYECNSNSSKWVIPSVFSIQVQFAISDVGDGISTIKKNRYQLKLSDGTCNNPY